MEETKKGLRKEKSLQLRKTLSFSDLSHECLRRRVSHCRLYAVLSQEFSSICLSAPTFYDLVDSQLETKVQTIKINLGHVGGGSGSS